MSDFALAGSLSAVDQLAARIGQMGQRAFLRGMLGEMGQAAVNLVHDEFAASHDPDGRRWEPLKEPRRFGAGPLVKTGALQASIRVRLSPEGFALYTLKKYAVFHQKGTRTMVARPFFPIGTPPPSWLMRFDHIAEAHMRRLLPAAG